MATQIAPPAICVAIHCLGTLRVFVDGVEVAPDAWVSVKARDLLAYFVHCRHTHVSLEMALSYLLPDYEQIGKTAFHSALYRLRQVLRRSEGAGKLVKVKGGDYWLNEGKVAVDVDRFDQALAHARTARPAAMANLLENAVQLYQGDYLSNLRYYD